MTMSDSVKIDEDEGIRLSGGNEDLYHSIMKTYLRGIPVLKKRIQDDMKSDISDYTIAVHALKSSSRSIGAAELGDMAYECEFAGKAGDMAKIGVLTGPLLERLDKVAAYIEIRLDQINMQENAGDPYSSIESDNGSTAISTDRDCSNAAISTGRDCSNAAISTDRDGSSAAISTDRDGSSAVISDRYVNGSIGGDNEGNCSTAYGDSVRRYCIADVKGLTDDLKKALDEFDSSSAEKIINALGTISFSQEAADIVIECRDAVDCFDYDGVKAGIDRLCMVLGIT